MQNKRRYLKFLINSFTTVVCFLNIHFVTAQNETDSFKRIKIDGLAAVVGDFVILDSDIDKQFAQLEASGIST